MKKYLYSFAILLIVQNCFGQLHDANWLIGYHGTFPNHSMLINWKSSDKYTLETLPDFSPSFTLYSSSISNNEGNLLYYSNGLHLYGANHNILTNGDSINYGSYWDTYNRSAIPSYQSQYSGMFIPKPDSNDEYIYFHTRKNQTIKTEQLSPMYATFINKNNEVTQKNSILIDGAIKYFGLTKHANGRDYWLLVPDGLTNEFYVFLIDPNGIHSPSTYKTGPIFNFQLYGLGINRFSPDGSIFVVNDINNYTAIYSFDRCTGEVRYEQHFEYNDDDRKYPVDYGLIISPNSQYLYISNPFEVFQYDLKSRDIKGSGISIAKFDDLYIRYVNLRLPTVFTFFSTTPYQQIYCVAGNGNVVDHLMRRPDVKGLGCDFVQQGIDLPYWNFLSVPRFPNYRLQAFKGSPCDTLPKGPLIQINSELGIKKENSSSLFADDFVPIMTESQKRLLQGEHIYINGGPKSLFPESLHPDSIYIHQEKLKKEWLKSKQ